MSVEAGGTADKPVEKISLRAGALRAAGELQRGDLGVFKQSFSQLCNSPCRSIFVDLRHCSQLGSMFIGELAEAVMRMKAGGKDVHVEVSPELGKLLHMARMYCLFDYDICAAEL
jgi:anti-anti-sigma regulatory factor